MNRYQGIAKREQRIKRLHEITQLYKKKAIKVSTENIILNVEHAITLFILRDDMRAVNDLLMKHRPKNKHINKYLDELHKEFFMIEVIE